MPRTADVRALGEFAASRYGVVTITQAAALDISAASIGRLIRDGALERVRPGVFRFTASPPTWRQTLMGATIDGHAVARTLSAAAVHSLDGFTEPPPAPEILCEHGTSVRCAGALVARTRAFDPADLTVVDGIACTTIARTIIDLAPSVGADGLTRLLDDAQRRRVSLQWITARANELAARGRRGPREVLDAVQRRADGYRPPDSWFERLLAASLRSPILVGLVRQFELCDRRGRFVARFDLALPVVRLGIEGHSRSFHLGESAERYDEDRDIRTAKVGWDIHYLGFGATRSPERACADLEEVVVRRALDLGLPIPGTLAARRSA
jgi:hypothetical protein